MDKTGLIVILASFGLAGVMSTGNADKVTFPDPPTLIKGTTVSRMNDKGSFYAVIIETQGK